MRDPIIVLLLGLSSATANSISDLYPDGTTISVANILQRNQELKQQGINNHIADKI